MTTATKEKRPDFKCTGAEFEVVDKIAVRALLLDDKFGGGLSSRSTADRRMAWQMDILAAHNTCPLSLAELLAADDGNFAHDVFGIRRHINRDTGEIGGCFLPRYARKVPA